MSETRYGPAFEIETKRLDGDTWEVSGYASTYDRDLGDDVVVPGAFRKSLDSGARVRFLYQHDHRQPLGRVLELREDDRGLFGKFAISKTTLGQDVRTLLRDGSLDSFSIGYLPKEAEVDKKAGVRRLKEVELVEVSVVSIPMNPQALVTGVKQLDGGAIAQAVAEYVRDAEAKRRDRPIYEVLDEALREVKAHVERRRGDWREPSARVVAAVEEYRAALLEGAEALASLLAQPAAADAPAPAAEAPVDPAREAKAQPETDARSEQAPAGAGRHSEAIRRKQEINRLLRVFRTGEAVA